MTHFVNCLRQVAASNLVEARILYICSRRLDGRGIHSWRILWSLGVGQFLNRGDAQPGVELVWR